MRNDIGKKLCHFFKLSKIEMENKFQILINEETLIEMHFIIDTTFRSLGTTARNFESPHLPCQPLLINVLNMSKKGCSVYSNLLKKKKNLSSPLVERESRWHLELQTMFSTNFWNKTYKLTSEIKFENKIKWLQYQIVRNSLLFSLA